MINLERKQGLYSYSLDVGRDVESFVLLTSPSAEAIEFVCGLGDELGKLEESNAHLQKVVAELRGFSRDKDRREAALEAAVKRISEDVRNRQERIEALERDNARLQIDNDGLRIRVKGLASNEELRSQLSECKKQLCITGERAKLYLRERDEASEKLDCIRGRLNDVREARKALREAIEDDE